jgi:hypothetical protein
VDALLVAAWLSAVPLAGAADPADTPINPIPAAIKVAITILRIRFSLFCPLDSARGRAAAGRRSAGTLTPNRRVG